MRAVRAERIGGPEVMRVFELPTPAPAAGEALVRVEAAGVNFVDVYNRSGLYASKLPVECGSEGAGIVEALGAGVGEVAVGERVAWANVPGSYATHVVARAASLVRVPPGVTTRTAAAAMMQGMTAHFLARDTYPLRPRDTCMVHAAAGGVGLLLCQIASHAGARVVGVVSTDTKAELARGAGCAHVVVSTREDFEVEARRITAGAGVDVVYDSVGAATWERSLRSLARRGMMVSYGNASGAVPPFAPLVLAQLGSLYVTRPKLGDYVATRDELVARAGELFTMIASGALGVRVHAELPLDAAPDAHRLLESRATTGKVLLVP